jgi:hypothetical protein
MAISGRLDGEEEYFLWGLKELSYVMKMMAKGGLLQTRVVESRSGGGWKGGLELLEGFDFLACTKGIINNVMPLMITVACTPFD